MPEKNDTCFHAGGSCLLVRVSHFSSWDVPTHWSNIPCTAWYPQCDASSSSVSFSKDCALERLAVVGRLFCPEQSQLSDQEMADVAVQEVKQLCNDLQIPNLENWGIDRGIFQKAVYKMTEINKLV